MSTEKPMLMRTFTLALLCLACADGGMRWVRAGSDPNLSRRCVESLAEVAKSAGAVPSSVGDRLRIGKDELRLGARVEQAVPAHSGYVVGILVDVSINGSAHPLTAGVTGTGATREEAVAAAVSAWSQLVGVALLDALGVKQEDKAVFSAGRFSAHAGRASIASPASPQDVAWSDERRRELLGKLGGVIRGLEASPSEFHLILIMVRVQPDSTIDGECRVDGEVSQAVLKAAQAFRWPQAQSYYLLKQYYVLRRRSSRQSR
jgi:Family of unknown function (DUF6348)